jgi:hypothetical protein
LAAGFTFFSSRLAPPSITVKTGASSPLLERSELRERRALREAQGSRVAGKPPGLPFFWVLFFGEAKKVQEPPAHARESTLPIKGAKRYSKMQVWKKRGALSR